ncbi:putative ATP synthase YscN [bacterium HR19]|nr:putative ATP synthase YscN [bacterium HR19]
MDRIENIIKRVESKIIEAGKKEGKIYGKIENIFTVYVTCYLPNASVGDYVVIHTPEGKKGGEVVGFKDGKAIVIPYEGTSGLSVGMKVESMIPKNTQKVGFELLGRIVDGLGQPLDSKGPIKLNDELPIFGTPENPLKRKIIDTPLDVGVRVINAILTVGRGQRMGIFGGSGIGKSTLLGMMARHTKADVNVVALIGERGREVKEFIEKILGDEGLKKSVVVVATSDNPPLLRIRAAFLAHTYAEYFMRQGMDVLLIMDSVTRFSMAMREVGLALGEPPTARGYTPSVFSTLPKLLERAGSFEKGTITAFYTILVEGDDTSEPISDNIRAIVDGHIILSRQLFTRRVLPSVDVLSSISRVMPDIISDEHLEYAFKFVRTLSDYVQAEDLITIGAYKGGDPRLDFAISKSKDIFNFITQKISERATFEESVQKLIEIMK